MNVEYEQWREEHPDDSLWGFIGLMHAKNRIKELIDWKEENGIVTNSETMEIEYETD